MAASMSYSQLVLDIQTYAERSEQAFIDQIPRMIMLAENRIASEVRGLGYLRIVNGTLQKGNPVIPKPTRWRETGFVYVHHDSKIKFLKQRSYVFCKNYWPNVTLEGVPEYYADYDYEHFFMAPTPDSAMSFELAYFERPAPLDETNQTNWTTQYAPQLLLYGSLLEAQPFLKQTSRLAEFQSLFDRASAAVTAEAERRIAGDQTLQRTTG